MNSDGYATTSGTSTSFQSGNTTPHEGLKNMLDLAEVISELKAVIAQQNKLLEQLSKKHNQWLRVC